MSAPSPELLHSPLEPVVGADTRVLVLGSLPGVSSLAAGRYYAHPRNRFWHLAGQVIGQDLESLDYDARLAALLSGGIGLWDTVASARRKGSLDADIRDAVPRDLNALCDTLPALRAVAFNGKTSARIGTGQVDHERYSLVTLPSSSPANAAVPLAEKERQWLELRKFI
ncbi:DNA-deoxyinosine glycosylase [Alteraurantiacibacter aquimixticola]|uniref:DNA-deoxyinosine glycosylase n=1 Tax=Alteraurantiacibacter aquimixticola TaxID=2489173 RepID=A0A4T3F4Q2_9SPHN|nr:DNA-deoxyinosine glycosylase [Alteraurantiacibacter aquimixticola]TIX51439.1 DNA-deoxyinosine glycosylase [Alteraurantiacibacter aquimixticola]